MDGEDVLLYLHACQMRVTVGDSVLCCCVCVTSFEGKLTPLCVDSVSIHIYNGKVWHLSTVGPVWPSGKALGW